jgi:hypothetical protein
VDTVCLFVGGFGTPMVIGRRIPCANSERHLHEKRPAVEIEFTFIRSPFCQNILSPRWIQVEYSTVCTDNECKLSSVVSRLIAREVRWLDENGIVLLVFNWLVEGWSRVSLHGSGRTASSWRYQYAPNCAESGLSCLVRCILKAKPDMRAITSFSWSLHQGTPRDRQDIISLQESLYFLRRLWYNFYMGPFSV